MKSRNNFGEAMVTSAAPFGSAESANEISSKPPRSISQNEWERTNK